MIEHRNRLTAGILGGMGPEATVDLMRRVIALTPSADDGDHIRMLVDCDPSVPSRVKAIIDGSGESPAPALVRMARGLVHQGADFLAMPCNTAHHYFADIAAASAVPVVNMLENAAQRIHAGCPDGQRVGVLASTAVRITSLYETPFARVGKTLLFPKAVDQERLMALIFAVKARRVQPDDTVLRDCARGLLDAGADILMIACTELSVVAGSIADAAAPCFDSADLLAREIVARAIRERPNDPADPLPA